mgnify:CR=1 FL=1
MHHDDLSRSWLRIALQRAAEVALLSLRRTFSYGVGFEVKDHFERFVAFLKENLVAISWFLTISLSLFYYVMLMVGGD